MAMHQFTLIVEGVNLQSDEIMDALFEAGCDDGTVGSIGSVQYIDFDREGDSLADAVLEATEAIERAVPGARVVHMEPDELVTISDIAKRIDRTRESVRLLVSGERGPGTFPAPATHLKGRQRMWYWQDVVSWLSDAGLWSESDAEPGRAEFITAYNANLRWRAARGKISHEHRRRLAEFAD